MVSWLFLSCPNSFVFIIRGPSVGRVCLGRWYQVKIQLIRNFFPFWWGYSLSQFSLESAIFIIALFFQWRRSFKTDCNRLFKKSKEEARFKLAGKRYGKYPFKRKNGIKKKIGQEIQLCGILFAPYASGYIHRQIILESIRWRAQLTTNHRYENPLSQTEPKISKKHKVIFVR